MLFPPAPTTTDLHADPAIQPGELANGVRYAIRANPEPRGRASLRLVVAAGSLHETEAQRGLAHFLEHMAFNGSEHYPPGTLIEFFQRMGMNFGGDTNAYTSFDRTVYSIELPDTRPETLAEGLRVLADYAGHLLLQPEEIDRERGVILAEKLARDSADYRSAIAAYQFFYAGTHLPERLPIGLESVIKSADRSQFADFYDTWYRPERIAVIAVGDFAPELVQEKIAAAFAPLAARAPARATPDFGAPSPRAVGGAVFGHHYEPEASSTTVTLQVVAPPDLAPDTSAKRLRELPLRLAHAMLNRRLSELAKSETAPFVRASADRDAFPALWDGVELNLIARPGQWRESLRVGENELRRALLHGFHPSELREAIAEERNELAQAAKTAPTRRSADHTEALVDAFIEGTVPTSPEADLALLGPALDGLTPAACLAALRTAWSSPAGLSVGIFGNTDLGTTDAARATIAQVYQDAAALPLEATPERTEAKWAYAEFGPAGSIATRREVTDFGITQVVFANGVRLNLKPTDFEKGRVSLRARLGSGKLTEPRDQAGLAFFANSAFTAGGLGKHTDDELKRILAGKNVGLGLQVADDALALAGQTTPEDLALQFQLLAAYLADPGFRPEAQLSARRRLEPFYAKLATDPSGPLNLQVPKLLASGDPRFGLPERHDVLARTMDELRAWMTPQLAEGPVEVALTGDFAIEPALAAAATTIGALPTRTPKPAYTAQRQVNITPPATHTFAIHSSVTKTVLAFYWPTADARDTARTRRLNLLAAIFSDRLRQTVREEIGGSYSPFAASVPSDTFTDYGFIFARVVLDPSLVERVQSAILAAAENLAAHGITQDELDRARLPILTEIQESERTNAYWLNSVLTDAQERPERLERARTRLADHQAISKAEIDALAAAYLSLTRSIRFTINASPATAPDAPPAP